MFFAHPLYIQRCSLSAVATIPFFLFQLFDLVRGAQPHTLQKLVPIMGDVVELGLGEAPPLP